MSDNPKKRLRILAVTAFFLVFLVFPVCLYVLLRFGFPPFIGNLLSARSMTSYAAQVHPDWTPEGGWAGYNLVDGRYWLSFTDGTQSHSLGYAGGMVRDKEREETLQEELEISKALRINGLWLPDRYTTYWSACWPAKTPDQPRVTVDVTFYDGADVPVPDESAMRERMADEAMRGYEGLAPVSPIHNFSVRYCHRGIQGEHHENIWHIIQADLSETSLSREDILLGELTVK